MNKEMFLKELSDRLQILNEKERQEILEEYAQHIDLKIESGLSEEAAVKDFGTPEELSAELLDVYHINSEFASQNEDKKKLFEKIPMPKLKKEPEYTGERTEEQLAREQEEKRLKEEARRIRVEERKLKSEERKLKNEENRAKAALWREEHHAKKAERKEKRREKYSAMRMKYEEQKRLRQEIRIKKGGSWISRFFGRTWDVMVGLMLVFWKFCLCCAALPVVFLGLFALFCTGMVVVLLQQGYPLTGITMIGCGIFLASAGVSGLILSYVFSGKKHNHDIDH